MSAIQLDNIFSKTKGDRWIWLIVVLLSIISMLAVYSSIGTLAFKRGVGAESILMKHLAMVIGGIGLMYISHKLDYRYYAGISKVLMVITIPLLLYTLVFGARINEASRWIAIPGTGLSFQTSDLAKLALITYLARTLLRGVCFNSMGQHVHGDNAVRRKHIAAHYGPRKRKADSRGLFRWCNGVIMYRVFRTPPQLICKTCRNFYASRKGRP
jgi:cell division protein FtsW (lipid II flippase)